jgi:hypothetical protein
VSGDDRNARSARERSDEDLLDSLYGEREDLRDDGARAPGAEADDDLELAQLRRMRGVFAELKANQEEPPPAGMALLMAAARRAAEERQPQQAGLWTRLRAGWHAMVAHPAMAAAAAAVVVIGASGYLMSRGVKTAESTYSSSEGERAASTSGAASAPGASGASGPADEKGAELRAADRPEGPAPSAAATTTAPAPAPIELPSTKQEMGSPDAELQRRGVKKVKSAPISTEEAKGPTRRAPSGSGAYGGSTVDRDQLNYSSQAGGAPAGAPPAQAPAAAPPPPPPPPAEPRQEEIPEAESAADRNDGESAPSTSKDTRRPEKPTTVESIAQQSERWYVLAKEAAAKGNCDAVKLLAQRVQGENPGFYEKRFKRDASLAKCL